MTARESVAVAERTVLARGWAVAVLALSLIGCGSGSALPGPERRAAGEILQVSDGLGSARVYQHCENGDRLYVLIGNRKAAMVVVPGGCGR